MFSSQIVAFLGIIQEMEKLRASFRASMRAGVTIQFAIVGQDELPGAINAPTLKQRCLGIVDLRDIMSESLSIQRLAR